MPKPMRRNQCEITDPKEIERILSATNIGRLGTTGADGYPYIVPVNFVWMEGKGYFHCALEGEKLDNIERDPRVCFEVDIPLAYLDSTFRPDRTVSQVHQFYHCIIIRGTARVAPDGPLKTDALNALVAKHEGSTDFDPVTEDMPAYKMCHVIEIDPVSISAKSDLYQGKPDGLRQDAADYLTGRGLPGDLEAARAMGVDASGADEDGENS
ncbi:MAG: pyridoxamine 5'-phosphate oxidase family protein [Deltaproteobacteria bacterium]|nr:pyridoxamine 5'-phosphate oxidase family protein [Deltaproteobacteria bacterium]MBW2283607.1 pyridoxamine 5'-phosphate oxidase family protein [Deltaproteobacteria bacterium]